LYFDFAPPSSLLFSSYFDKIRRVLIFFQGNFGNIEILNYQNLRTAILEMAFTAYSFKFSP
jgi:hypothetical protein